MTQRRRATWNTAAALAASLIVATTASAAGPSGFSDGQWEGRMVWNASVQFPAAFGAAESTGKFTMELSGGMTTGEFSFIAPNTFADTADASADLLLLAAGTVSGTADKVLLVPSSMEVTGIVRVEGYSEPFPVEFALGEGQLSSLPLDIVNIGCSQASGVFTTRATELAAEASSAGASLSVQRATWSAIRVGEAGATTADQKETIDELLADGVDIADKIDDGVFDADRLEALMRRAAELSRSIARNETCQIATPGHFTTAVAGLVADILHRMTNHADLFSVHEFVVAIVAGAQAGAFGSPGGEELALKISNALTAKLATAIAEGNAQDLLEIAIGAWAIGDDELATAAIDEEV